MNQIQELPVLPPGRYDGVILCAETMRVKVVRRGDTYYALNNYSTSPVNMRSREERSAWARAVGLPVREVEAFVQREKRRLKKEALNEALHEAVTLLTNNGFTVTNNKELR